MKILLLGANGLIGSELQRDLKKLGDVKACTRSDIDMSNFCDIRSLLSVFSPQVIVNAAAYTSVDMAESEYEHARRINYEAVDVLARQAKHIGAWLIHFSTDYVFDGTKRGAYVEDDIPNPINVYGKTKLDGENAIIHSGCAYTIFRTSWVVGPHGVNFVRSMLRLAQEREDLSVVADQFGAPTSTQLISRVTLEVIEKLAQGVWPEGVFHLASQGEATWNEVARFVVGTAIELGVQTKLKMKNIKEIATSEYPAAAERPLNSTLSTEKISKLLNFSLPRWENGVSDVVERLSREQLTI